MMIFFSLVLLSQIAALVTHYFLHKKLHTSLLRRLNSLEDGDELSNRNLRKSMDNLKDHFYDLIKEIRSDKEDPEEDRDKRWSKIRKAFDKEQKDKE